MQSKNRVDVWHKACKTIALTWRNQMNFFNISIQPLFSAQKITKSMVIWSVSTHVLGKSCNNATVSWCAAFTCWQVKHNDTKETTFFSHRWVKLAMQTSTLLYYQNEWNNEIFVPWKSILSLWITIRDCNSSRYLKPLYESTN